MTYALGIYHLNLFIAFLSPKVDPSLMEDSGTAGPTGAVRVHPPGDLDLGSWALCVIRTLTKPCAAVGRLRRKVKLLV